MSATSLAEKWVDGTAGTTRPSNVVWCDGSKAEYDRLIEEMLRDGTLLPLNARTYPSCYLHRSHPSDVARTEQLTFICTRDKQDAGPTNNWMAPPEAKAKAGAYFDGAMRGRAMYVIPYLMGPAGSTMSRTGIMVTDSAYVVASMHIMARVGNVAMKAMRRDDDFIAGVHSLGDLSPDRRLILHFPEEKLIWSVGSGYGGNALLGKKCHALRLGSWQARQEGWLAEHMLIIGVEDPKGDVTYLAAAMPSASGKTNLAMAVSSLPGWRVWTVGDDIAWIHVDSTGQLRAINPEKGFFGVAPNTSPKTNPNATAMVKSNTIFTNVAVTPSGEPWWEGLTPQPATGPRASKAPRIFRVNWFRKGEDGKFLWPGYGDNVRVLKWIVERIRGGGRAQETPIGWIPAADGLDTEGLGLSRAQLAEALRVDRGEWLQALADLGDFYDQFGSRLPQAIAATLADTRRKLGA